jgi:putative endonuclease
MTSSRSSSRRPSYGRRAELLAAWHLRARGYRIVAHNTRVAGREVDLVARRGRTLVVCEVKGRRSGSRGRASEAVSPRQRERLRVAAEALLAAHPDVTDVRIDLVAVDGWRVRHLPGAL